MVSTAPCECQYDWQTVYIECTKEKDPYCGMELSVQCDNWYVTDSWDALIECWNRMSENGRKKLGK